ncbi:peptidoglycan recognition protein family protein [Herbidospora yilanensis]|uniref:peptidoglycan recognition protein family protein n=1 Tax=Herbidospora yilanensis TaxID=354426 RepID=UPI000780A525|nr:peptidoglycan recognition family protein [Herbidospora yilanensis]
MPLDRRHVLSLGFSLGIAGAAVPLLGVQRAEAARGPIRPRIHERLEWEAREPRETATILRRAPEYIVIHHTATSNTMDDTVEHAYRLSRAIQKHHMRRNRWDDIGEQFTISRGGHIMEGRNRTLLAVSRGMHAVGAHTADHNRSTLGIENEGTYARTSPPLALLGSLVKLTAWLCATYDLNPYEAIVGHRDLNNTRCPGDYLYDLLPELRERVWHRMVGRRFDPLIWELEQAALPRRGVMFAERPERVFDHGPAIGLSENLTEIGRPG